MAKVIISGVKPWTVVPQKTSTTGNAHMSEAKGHMQKAGLTQATLTKEMKNNKIFGIGVGP